MKTSIFDRYSRARQIDLNAFVLYNQWLLFLYSHFRRFNGPSFRYFYGLFDAFVWFDMQIINLFDFSNCFLQVLLFFDTKLSSSRPFQLQIHFAFHFCNFSIIFTFLFSLHRLSLSKSFIFFYILQHNVLLFCCFIFCLSHLFQSTFINGNSKCISFFFFFRAIFLPLNSKTTIKNIFNLI